MGEIPADVGQKCGFGHHAVTVIPHFLIEMSDGTKISLKIWFPSKCLENTNLNGSNSFLQFAPERCETLKSCPVILEHLPYRKSDYTLQRDFQRHTWMCSQGYVIIRSDMRGNGDSEGLYYDEYEEQELNDACEIIQWAAAQTWCNGRVGMYGKSWGGFNGLQVAFKQPEALKTIVSLYSTDDRYATDIHYMGGCVLGVDMIGWSAVMFGFNGRPPHPVHVANWKKTWIKRLENQEGPLMNIWLSHQARDDYWEHGSVCEDPGRIGIPVLAIGGFNDSYRDAVFRMAKTLPNFRGIVGPWSHDWPDCNKPGPHIEYMIMCKEWWDKNLKQIDNNVMDCPLLRVFLQDAVPPSTVHPDVKSGRWISMDKHETGSINVFVPNGNGTLLPLLSEAQNIEQAEMTSFPSEVAGLVMMEYLSFGDNDGAGDQRVADAHSLCWTSDELQNDMSILGNPQFECLLSSDKDQANIAVRLVDVFPDGKSTLITFGVLNLCHRDGHSQENIRALVPGEKYKVKVEMRAISYVVPKGHRIRLAVCPNYFPMIWPSRENATLQITAGCNMGGINTKLILPNCPANLIPIHSENVMKMTESPKLGPPLPKEILREPHYKRYSVYGLAEPIHKYVIDVDAGRKHLLQTDTILDSRQTATYSIEDGKPLSAEALIEGFMKIEHPSTEGGIATCLNYTTKLWSDYENFFSDSTLTATMNGEVVHEKTWKKTIPRFYV